MVTGRYTRRDFLELAGRAAAGLALGAPLFVGAGCTSGDTESSAAGPVQLVYQDWRTEWFPPMAQEQLAAFHAEHADIRVFYTPDPEDFVEKMLADMRGGTAPDIFQGCCAHFPAWAQKGYTLDLRPYVARDMDQETIADWDPAQYASFFSSDGLQFGLPKYHGALGVYYNKDLFDLYQVPYPAPSWTHDDYLATMKVLTRDLDGDGATDLWGSMLDISWDRVQVHVNGWGGSFVDPNDPRHSLISAPESLAAIEWLRARMWDDQVMARPQDVQNLSTRDAFASGLVAMVEDGSWALKDILEKSGFRVGVAPFPGGPARRVTLSTTDGFGIYSGTRHPEAAWELMKFLVSPAYGRAMAKASFLQPARGSLVSEWVGFVREEFPDRVDDVDLNVFAEGHRQGYSVTAEVFAAGMDEIAPIAAAAFERILTLGQASVDSISEASAQIAAVLARSS